MFGLFRAQLPVTIAEDVHTSTNKTLQITANYHETLLTGQIRLELKFDIEDNLDPFKRAIIYL